MIADGAESGGSGNGDVEVAEVGIEDAENR